MAKQKIIAGHLDHKHGYYYMVLSLPNPEKGNRKLPKWFPTGIPYDGKRQTERDAKRMLKEWREDFTSGKLTLAMIDAKKRSKGTDGAMSLKSIPIRKDMYFTDYCALPGFVDSKNEEKTERNAGYLVVSHSGGGMLRQGTRKGIRRTPANRGMRAHWVVKGLDISEDVCHGMCP